MKSPLIILYMKAYYYIKKTIIVNYLELKVYFEMPLVSNCYVLQYIMQMVHSLVIKPPPHENCFGMVYNVLRNK